MGFWSQITGADAMAGAYNAVLAEHALSQLLPAENERVHMQFAQSAMSGVPRGTDPRQVLASIEAGGRILQLNMFAIAMADCAIAPLLPREMWMQISNPFSALPNTPALWAKVRNIEADMLRKHAVHIHVPNESYF